MRRNFFLHCLIQSAKEFSSTRFKIKKESEACLFESFMLTNKQTTSFIGFWKHPNPFLELFIWAHLQISILRSVPNLDGSSKPPASPLRHLHKYKADLFYFACH